MEDEEALQTGALVSQLADPVQDQVHDLLADGVVATGVVVGGVLLASHQLLGVEQLAVGAGADLICQHTVVCVDISKLSYIKHHPNTACVVC